MKREGLLGTGVFVAASAVLLARFLIPRPIAMSNNGDGFRVPGIVISARDEGPGIPDVNRAMEPGYSTAGGLGLGLPGVRRIMDKFEIVSEVNRGTVVTVTKWKR